ncbi:MAG: peptide deformylase [Roseivivax sp.]|nr:peptide deformylase [Roseivivax sp.]
MTIRPILAWPDPRLSQACAPLTSWDGIDALIGDMFETMYAAPGRGLAAPQLGVMLRLFVMDPTWRDGGSAPLVCINPEIAPLGQAQVASAEGCLSLPGVETVVQRWARIRLRYYDIEGAPQERQLDGFAARCAQHEADHLDGIMTLHRLDEGARIQALADYEAGR